MEQQLIEFINTLDHSMKKFHESASAAAGVSRLTINQFRYLDTIHAMGEPTITEISGKLNITKASVTTAINKLEAMGYVTKTRSIEDKRVFHIALSQASEPLIEAKRKALVEYDRFIRSALTGTEVKEFQRILSKLVQHFKQE